MISADALDTIIIGTASLAIAGMSFVYASRAQQTSRATAAGVVSDTAQAAATALAGADTAAYSRARELYESAIDSLRDQNTSLHAEIARVAAENTALRDRVGKLEEKIRRLDAKIRRIDGDDPP